MEKLRDILSRVISENPSFNTNQHCISLYFPNKSLTKTQFCKELKAFTIDNFKRTEIAQLIEISHNIALQIDREIGELDDIKMGVACFAKIEKNTPTKNNSNDTLKDKLIILSLNKKPLKDFVLDNAFDYRQLLAIMDTTDGIIVIDLDQESAKIIEVDNGELKTVSNVENQELEKHERNENKKTTPTKWGSTYGTTGQNENKFQRQIEVEVTTFADKVVKDAIKVLGKKADIRYAVVTYSSYFNEIIDKFISTLKQGMPHLKEVEKVSKTTSNDKELLSRVLLTVDKIKAQSVNEIFKKASETFHNFASSIDEVCDACNLARIDTLFIRPRVRFEGFLDSNGLVFTKDGGNFKKVNNLALVIVDKVRSTGGQVVVTKRKDVPDLKLVAARLRF